MFLKAALKVPKNIRAKIVFHARCVPRSGVGFAGKKKNLQISHAVRVSE
jgi:hypothetical protein